jgi:hypothetical protein
MYLGLFDRKTGDLRLVTWSLAEAAFDGSIRDEQQLLTRPCLCLIASLFISGMSAFAEKRKANFRNE